MKNKFICVVLCIVLSVVMLAGCGGNDQQGEDAQTKEITVVATGSFFPISYTDDNGELTGFEVEAIKEVANRAGVTINWELSDDYTAMFSGLDSGLYDTIVGQVSVTPERERPTPLQKNMLQML